MQILENKDTVFYIFLLLALFLSHIPILGKYFRSVNTLIHESGHALATLVLSGEVIAINLFSDTSGNTVTKSKSRFSQIIISLSGYIFSSAVGLIFMMMINKYLYTYILIILTSLALLIMILSIKNTYGLFWTGTFVTLNLLLLYFNNAESLYYLSLFYSLIIFTDSVFSAFVVLILSIKQPKKAGDASNLQKSTGIPSFFWGLLFCGMAIFSAFIAVSKYFPYLKDWIKTF